MCGAGRKKHRARAVDGYHLHRSFGRDDLRVEPRLVESADDEEGLPDRVEEIARHGRIRTQRNGDAQLEHLGPRQACLVCLAVIGIHAAESGLAALNEHDVVAPHARPVGDQGLRPEIVAERKTRSKPFFGLPMRPLVGQARG